MFESFKIKINGQKVIARLMKSSDRIHLKSLYGYVGYDIKPEDVSMDMIKQLKFIPSNSVGDKVSEHPIRVYIEVLSPFYKEHVPTE